MDSLKVRFDKFDDYGNLAFSVSGNPADVAYDKQTYETLFLVAHKLKKDNPDVFLPVYADASKKFATLRMRKPVVNVVFKVGYTYELNVSVRAVKRTGKKYINVVLNSGRMVKKAPKRDYGEEIKFILGDDDDEDIKL